MDGAQVGVFEKTNKVGLRSLLKGSNGRRLEAEVGLEVLSNLANQTLKMKCCQRTSDSFHLEWELADEQFGGFLVATNFTKSNGTGAITVRLFDSSGGRSRLAGSLKELYLNCFLKL